MLQMKSFSVLDANRFRLGHKIAAATLRLAVPNWLSSTIYSREEKAHRVYEAMIAFSWVAGGCRHRHQPGKRKHGTGF